MSTSDLSNYKILGIGHHTETLKELFVYEANFHDDIYGQNAVWIRSAKKNKEALNYDCSKKVFPTNPRPSAGEMYRHYRNEQLYKIIGVGRDVETLEELVVYEAQYDDANYGHNAIWIRPLDMFMSFVDDSDVKVKRFNKLD